MSMLSHNAPISNGTLNFLLRSAVGALLIIVILHNCTKSNYRHLGLKNTITVSLPPVISNNLADVMEPLGLTDTAIFWHIPKSGGSTADEFSYCIGLTVASQAGKIFGYKNDQKIAVFQPWRNHKAVNVDTTSISGLKNAKSRGLAQSLLADVVFSPFVHEVADMFTPRYKGRMAALFRHPVERAASLFYYLQYASWEIHYEPEMKNWSMQQFATSRKCPPNWTMWMLLGQGKHITGDNEKDLELSKAILRQKVLIGLTSQMEESFERFDKYFDFDDGSGVAKMCSSALLSKGNGKNIHIHPKIVPGGEDWKILASINEWDIKLYEYAVHLFEEQADMFYN